MRRHLLRRPDVQDIRWSLTISRALHSADQTLVALRGPFSGRSVWLSGWDASNNGPYEDSVFGLHHPKGHPMAFSKGSANQRRNIPVRDYGTVLDAIPVLYYIGTTEGGSSGSGLFYNSEKGYLVGVLSSGLGCNDPSNYGSFRDFFPVIRRHIDPGGTEQLFKAIGRVPFFPRDRLPRAAGLCLPEQCLGPGGNRGRKCLTGYVVLICGGVSNPYSRSRFTAL